MVHTGKASIFVSWNYFSQDRNGNCQPGTTIDQEVCHPTLFDYYQFGHAGIQVFNLFILVFSGDVSNLRYKSLIKRN